jgi:hypothetical protein
MTAPHAAAGVIRQGEDCWIEALNIRDVRGGDLIDVTGWKVHAVARAWYARIPLGRRVWQYRMQNPVMSEWSTAPTGTQGVIIAGIGNDNTDPYRIRIHVTPAQTDNWRAPMALIQAKMWNPVTNDTARVVDEIYEVAFDALPDSLTF